MKIVPIIVILTSIGLFFGYVDPTYTQVKALRLEKADYDRALNNSKDLQEERNKLLKKVDAMPDSDLTALTKLLPDHIDNVRLIIDIDEMAKTYNMKIRSFKADTAEKKDTIGKDNSAYGTLTLTFSTSASYGTFLAFLRDLEHSLRLIDVSSISFVASESNPLYDYTVTVKTYWLK
jgi:type IV pilus assembly protein PilO